MVRRVLYPKDEERRPSVDRYDCIIVNECHRGYLLDRELSDTELTFRNLDDYISKYRRVIYYFDAVKIGLTATPALHTTQIFGAPIFTYGYREAVVDGFLIDYEPPVQIRTSLSESGIKWEKGSEAKLFLQHNLTSHGLVHRYLNEDGLPGGEATFALCSFWLVDCLAQAGRASCSSASPLTPTASACSPRRATPSAGSCWELPARLYAPRAQPLGPAHRQGRSARPRGARRESGGAGE